VRCSVTQVCRNLTIVYTSTYRLASSKRGATVSREERMEAIVKFLETCLWSVTVGEIGRGVGLKRTPYLTGMIAELVESGKVSHEQAIHPKYGPTRFYWIERGVK
jgi:hypothetical protein